MAFNAATKAEITRQAEANGITPRNLLAVVDVESAGVVTWKVNGLNVPPARPEAHHFYKRLKGDQRARAVALGLAHPKAGKVKVPGSRAGVYDVIERMAKINRQAAYESISWGVGQVMGFHWKKLKYADVEKMKQACYTLAGSVDCMLREVKASSLVNKLNAGGATAKSWQAFSLGYNGKLALKWGYHTKMARAWNKLSTVKVVADESERDEVRDMQQRFARAGYYKGAIDGIAGAKTKAAIKAFQKDQGLRPDGIYGTLTRDALDEYLASQDKIRGEQSVVSGGGLAGAGAIGEKVVDQVSTLQWSVGGFSVTLDAVMTVLIVIGIGLVLYGLYRQFRAKGEVLEVNA